MANDKWRETSVRLAAADVAVFEGPGKDWTLIIHGTRAGRGQRQAAPAADALSRDAGAKRTRQNAKDFRKR